MTIFLKTNVDGFDSEGIGSVVQWNLLLFCIAKDLGVNITVSPFKNIAHYNYNDYSSEDWSKSFTDFFRFPYLNEFDLKLNFDGEYQDLCNFIKKNSDSKKNISVNIPTNFIVKYGQKNLLTYFQKKYLKEIKKNFQIDKNYFKENCINISLHIRSSNLNDVDFCLSRETFGKHINSLKYKNLIFQLKTKHKNDEVCLHIHSQGKSVDFEDIVEMKTKKFQIESHLNDHPTMDIYHMSNADYLIMANSSYSWICHLLNFNPTYVRDNFWHSMYPNHIRLDSDYKIITPYDGICSN